MSSPIQPYYGPKTFEEAIERIEELNNNHWMSPSVIINIMREGGYGEISDKVAEKYNNDWN